MALASVISSGLFLSTIDSAASNDFTQGMKSSEPLPDLSGLAWLHGDIFLAVHDAKNPDELSSSRFSLLAIPNSLQGVMFRPVEVKFPHKASSDLESAVRIPGTNKVMFAESTDDKSEFDRIFLGEFTEDGEVGIIGKINWSEFVASVNIEAIAVASNTQNDLLFFWAERNDGESSTVIHRARLSLEPFHITYGSKDQAGDVIFNLPDSAYLASGTPLYSRPISAMKIDGHKRVYVVAANDIEGSAAYPDNGPYRSIVYQIGDLRGDNIELFPEPVTIATLDGFKAESLEIREIDGNFDIFVGTDDENFGGVLRQIPLDRSSSR